MNERPVAGFLSNSSTDQTNLLRIAHDLHENILPYFGHVRLNRVSQSGMFDALGSESEPGNLPPGTADRLQSIVRQMCTLAVQLRLPGSETITLPDAPAADRPIVRGNVLTPAQARRLLQLARASPNPQLKFVVALLMLTGVKQAELLNARWSEIDFRTSAWHVPASKGGEARSLSIDPSTIALLRALPRWGGCPFIIANPQTKKAHRSFARSWDSARVKAGLPYMEIHELTFFDLAGLFTSDELLEAVNVTLQARPFPRRTATSEHKTDSSAGAYGPQVITRAA